jgi:hypothetical protein
MARVLVVFESEPHAVSASAIEQAIRIETDLTGARLPEIREPVGVVGVGPLERGANQIRGRAHLLL